MPVWLQLIPALSQLIDRIIPDPQARDRAKLELAKAEQDGAIEQFKLALTADQMQADINAKEAENPSIFVSGWRPFIGWVCGVAFAWHFVGQPLLAFAIDNSGGHAQLPDFDMNALSTVLMGMLGLGGLRTIEKIRSR